MKYINRILWILLVFGLSAACTTAKPPRRQSFDKGWLFSLTADDRAADPAFDDSAWRPLDLPHDWAIEGEFSEHHPAGTGGGALPGGIGWYRKHFNPGRDLQGKHLFVDFDGVYMNSSVYINGHLLGVRPNGYASFSYEITPWLVADSDNLLAVKVDNSEQPNSRWYSGCGIYRHVWLREKGAVYLPLWGQQVVPYDITDETARLRVATAIVNASAEEVEAQLTLRLVAPDGSTAATRRESFRLPADPGAFLNPDAPRDGTPGIACSRTVDCTLTVTRPQRWSPDTPHRYRLETQLSVDGRTVDETEVVTGFRTLAFDAGRGFFLNGENLKINGVCLHHDAGALGAVVNRRAIERQLQLMKEMGANAIRTTHNAPAPELLDLCDSLGLMVMDEAFDVWRKRKVACDYSRYFDAWHERDLADLIRRDRNHPSVILWSIGNEVPEQRDNTLAEALSPAEAALLGLDCDLAGPDEGNAEEAADRSIGALLTRKLAGMVRALDPARPITAGCDEPAVRNHLFRSKSLDIIGYNYHEKWFDKVPQNFPGQPFVVTESVSGLMTRGYYRMPSDTAYIWPERWDKPFFDPSFSCSSYDNCHVPWGSTHETTLRCVDRLDFVSGQFIWTGFDYLGEPTPYGWPARSSYFGIVDLAGFPKDIYYMYQSRWRPDKTVLHLFPHWNWEPGAVVDLWAYYNNADEVELFVNGASAGIRHPEEEVYHAAWRVTFAPGTVEVISRKEGREVARQSIRTASEPCAVRLTPDRRTITADGTDLCYLTAEVVDREGNLCPWADNELIFTVDGAGRNVGVDNGSPISPEPFKSDRRRAFYGKALLIVQSDGTRGPIEVKAESGTLDPAAVTLSAK